MASPRRRPEPPRPAGRTVGAEGVRRTASVRGGAASLLGALLLVACTNPAPRPVRVAEDIVSTDATRRTKAVVEVGRRGDVSRVPELIELLDDPDVCVRITASATLRDLTGRDTGYVAWAPPETRREQVLAWRAWWASRGGAAGGAP